MAKRLGVTATPEITTRTITSSDQLLIIACDGIWDGLSNAEVVAVVNKHLERCEVMADGGEDEGAWKANVERASRMVTRECLAGLDRKMLDDNCTNICVFLRPVK